MDILVFSILYILFAHWIADWVLQSHWMASNKSNSLTALSMHVIAYTLSLMLLLAGANQLYPVLNFNVLAIYVVFNGVLHFAIDYFTSKLTASLWARQEWHNFFVAIGFDQLLHQFILIGSFAIAYTYSIAMLIGVN